MVKENVTAVILVGGEGTRLRPLTYNTPKPMVPVLNVPFLEHVIRNLRECDITDIIMAQYYLAESMANYFGDGKRFGVNLRYVMEGFPRGSAGAVKNVEQYLSSTTLVLNGDIFQKRNLNDMIEVHRQNKSSATILLTPVDNPTLYGVVETDHKGRVKRFMEKPKPEDVTTNMINAGTWVIKPDILKQVPPDIKYSFERDLFPRMIADGEPVYAYSSSNYWMDTGTPEKYLQLHRDLLSGKCDGYTMEKDVIIGGGCDIHSSVQFSGKVVIGDKCSIARGARLSGPVVIGPDCIIKEDAVIADSVIWHKTTINQRTVVKSSVIANDCLLGDDSYLIDAVLGDHVTVSELVKLKPFSRVMPGEIVRE
jgi:mannose-1-phosphate guanylyltransferase